VIHLIDQLLRRLIVQGVPGLTDNEVGFDPPDADWRQRVGVSDRLSVNVYLVDLVENRRLRSTAVTRATAAAEIFETSAPLRVDLHYLVSVWSPAQAGGAVEPTLDEHQLMGEVIAALAEAEPLSFGRVFSGVPLPVGTPAELVEHVMPFALLPVEGYPKLQEFWGTMGDTVPTRPVVYLVLTVPFFQLGRQAGRMVTTLRADYRAVGATAGEILHEIGGTVGDSATPLPDGTPAPVGGAWVELITATGLRLALTRTGDDGRFVFGRLPAADFTLRASHENLGITARAIVVPSATGEYDLTF
jgi:Pvc16 N-terminal domain